MIHCQARIITTYKSRKFKSVWPVHQSGVNDRVPPTAPQCNGDVTLQVIAVDEPEMGGHYAKTEVIITCTRCQSPYFPGIMTLQIGGMTAERAISNILNWSLAGETYSYMRAPSEAPCPTCSLPYRSHPLSVHRSHDNEPYLHLLCDGTLVKL